MTQTQLPVLVVDDDRRYRDLVRMNLARRGYQVLLAADGLTALNLLERDSVRLVILDVMLPDFDGYEICRRVREYSEVPIIMLTAKAEEVHKVRGFRLGADDYVTKPFGADELLERIEAVLRRSDRPGEAVAPPPLVSGDLVVDFAQRRVLRRGDDVQLTPREYRVLYHLAVNAGRVVVQDELLRRVWGPGYEDDVDILHATVRRLRRKIEDDPRSPRHVMTRRGIGYLFRGPAGARPPSG
jgi:two-component system KDP operon response regulator KdpE